MKTLIRNTFFNTVALFILTLLLPGVKVTGGFINFIIGGFFLALMFKVLKPILNLISLPLNLITLGGFSFFINVLILYLTVIFVPSISITKFIFPGISFSGFIIPQVEFNTFFAYIISAFLLTTIVSFLGWLIKR